MGLYKENLSGILEEEQIDISFPDLKQNMWEAGMFFVFCPKRLPPCKKNAFRSKAG